MDNREHYLKAFLISGIVLGVLSAIPVVNAANCCCLWPLLGGGLAGWILCRSAQQSVRAGEGALVGIFAGMIGGMISSLATAVNFLWKPTAMNEALEEALRNPSFQIPPEAEAYMDEVLQLMSQPGLWLGIIMLFSVLFFAIIALMGALISVSIFEPRFALQRLKQETQTRFRPPERGPGNSPGETDLHFPRTDKEEK